MCLSESKANTQSAMLAGAIACEQLADAPHRRLPLRGRMLMTTYVVSPTPFGDAFVVSGLLSQLDTDEVVVAAERWPPNPKEQTHLPTGHRVHFVTRTWTWPKRGQRFVLWLRSALAPRTIYRLAKLARRERCNAVFANFPNEHLLFAAYVVARLFRLKFFPFFHNTYRENRRGMAYVFASWLQRRVFTRADAVFVMSDGMKEELRRLYPGVRFYSLVHPFDREVPRFETLPAIERTRIRLAYMGSVNEANLDALRRICGMVNSTPDLVLNFYSAAADWHLKKEGLVGERIKREQPSDSELMDALRQSDLLVLPHGLTGGLAAIEYRTIFPTRTIPYLYSGRPIVAYSAKDSFLSRWLREHDCAEVVEDPDPAVLRATIYRLCDDPLRREELARNALAAAEKFRAGRVVAEMKRIINQHLPQNPSPR
jgi:glycosyltransferase involved in cell wall biosynthesis